MTRNANPNGRSRSEKGLAAVGVISLAFLFCFAVIEGTLTCWIRE